MNWKFWKKQADLGNGNGTKTPRSGRPKELPEAVGRKMVVSLKMDPDVVWALKYLSRPAEGRKDVYEFRIFDPAAAVRAGIVVRDWGTFDERPELIMYTGFYDKGAGNIDMHS